MSVVARELGSYRLVERLDGLDLETLVRRHGPLPAERAIYLLRQMCHSLAEAASHGRVHRDIKPANLFVRRYGGECDFVKVLDFGKAKETVHPPASPGDVFPCEADHSGLRPQSAKDLSRRLTEIDGLSSWTEERAREWRETHQPALTSWEVPLGERAARPGLEIPLETPSGILGLELKRHDDPPRAIASGMYVLSGVVPAQSSRHVGGQADVVSVGIASAAKQVDEASSGSVHASGRGISHTAKARLKITGLWAQGDCRIAIIASSGHGKDGGK